LRVGALPAVSQLRGGVLLHALTLPPAACHSTTAHLLPLHGELLLSRADAMAKRGSPATSCSPAPPYIHLCLSR
jgi:hypothetical protein